MIDFLILLSAAILVNFSALIFVVFKAAKHEDELAKKISKEVNNGKL